MGLAKGVTHDIRLRDPRPFRERSRRIAPGDIEDVRRHIQELLAAGIIKESRSPYASPIVVVRKKNGKVRMCIDYHLLNSRTIPDQYTMPPVDDLLDCLTGSKLFSVLDLRSGYYQVEISEEHKEKTAFLCPLGFFFFNLRECLKVSRVLLALKWADVNKFHDYLYGAQFTVRMDNNPLTYVLTTARLNAVGHRWLADLSTYNFSVQYKPGQENTDADLLSRHQRETEDGWVDIPPSGVKALCCMVNVSGMTSTPVDVLTNWVFPLKPFQMHMPTSLK